MRKLFFTSWILCVSLFAQAQDLIITGIFDGPLPGGLPKAVEIYVINDISDLSTYALGSANNGDGTDGEELFLSGAAAAQNFLYIGSELTEFQNFFGFAPNFIDDAVNVNGDDALELFNNGMAIDVFGDINTDGSGETWDYQDGWAYRSSGTGPDGNSFDINSWSFSGINENDDDTSQDTATNPFPIRTYSNTTALEINFEETLVQVSEEMGSIELQVVISEPADLSVDVVAQFLNGFAEDIDADPVTLNFTLDGSTTQTASFSINSDSELDFDYYVVFQLENNTTGILGEDMQATAYVINDEAHAPEAANVLDMELLVSYDGVAMAEIVTYDASSQRLFVSNSGDNGVEIVDFSNPASPETIELISMAAFGEEVTSVSAFQGVVAVAVAGEDQANGRIVLMNSQGTILSDIEAGALSDMVTFTTDGSKVLFANEGEPSEDYLTDPEGSVGIIDMATGASNITQDNVTILDFNEFDGQEAAFNEAGIRIFGPGATVSQDLEPEFITVTEDNTQAYIALQENNAIARVDLTTMEIIGISSLGTKDMNLPQNATDISNELPFVFLSTWNVQMMRQPDAIANYTVGGINYIVTANEGDGREYDAFEEVERGDNFNLDPTAFPNAQFLQDDNNLGRLELTNTMGDIDGDGDFDELFAFGARSFSIFNAQTGELVYDSADLLERITAEDPIFGAIFNTTDDENEFKNRSDDGGPEPEGVVVADIAGSYYAFIGLERIGGIMVFDITDPSAPIFETYVNNRDTTSGDNPTGDLAPEGLIYIAPEDNATGTGLLVVANEVSATISVYQLNNDLLSTDDFAIEKEIKIFPNPSEDGKFFFSEPSSYEIYDVTGRKLTQGQNATNVTLSNYKNGIYLIKFDNGNTQKVILK